MKEDFNQVINIGYVINHLTDKDKKVRDHDHITRKHRGSAHSNRNINLKLTKNSPVIFPNLRGYDGHLIMLEISKFDVGISVITNRLEKYMAFTINKSMIFIDSMQFMNSSLDVLVKNLSDNDFKHLSQEFSGDLLKLVKQKGVYPYEYMNSFKKFSEDKQPDRSKFYSSVKNKCISKKYYLLTNNVGNMLKMNIIGDDFDLYLKSDVLLLADVLEKFISTCLEYCKLDPCRYSSSPRLSSNAVLKMTRIELEIISDIEMYLFIEKGMKGGISCIAKRYSKANNKYIQSYDVNKPSKFILYLDVNSLYGWAMSQYLLYGGFKWLNKKQFDKFDVNLIEYNSIGRYIYISEVDFEYPDELHDLHNDYPLAPEKLKINRNMLSNYCINIANDYGIKIGSANKLVPNSGNKKNMFFLTKIFSCICH